MANQVNDRAFDLMTTAADKTAVDLFPPKKEEASSKNIHNALMAAGMTPAYGNIADLADATLYALEGEFGDAALSLTAVLPFIGQIATAKRIQKGVNSLPSSVQKKLLEGDYIPTWISYGSHTARTSGRALGMHSRGTGRKIEETNMIKNIIKHKTEKSRKLFEDMMKAEKTLKKFGIDINDF